MCIAGGDEFVAVWALDDARERDPPAGEGVGFVVGATIAMLARGSAARLRPCSAMLDTHSTGAPPSSP